MRQDSLNHRLMLWLNAAVNMGIAICIPVFNLWYLLRSETLDDAILNSLALLFILELDDIVSSQQLACILLTAWLHALHAECHPANWSLGQTRGHVRSQMNANITAEYSFCANHKIRH